MISVPNVIYPLFRQDKIVSIFSRDSRRMKNCFLIKIIIQVCPPLFFPFFIYPALPSAVTIRHIANCRIATALHASFYLTTILCIWYEEG